MPANLLYPESFAEQVRNLVLGSNITIDVLDETALSQGGYGGLMAVGGGSSRPPRLVRLSYSPEERSSISRWSARASPLTAVVSTSSLPRACTR